MTDQNANPNPSTPPPASPPQDWRELRRAERMAQRQARLQRHPYMHSGWIGGAMLVLLGVIFLLQNLGLPVLRNWWALFILLPAFWCFVAARDRYQDAQLINRGVAWSFICGVLLTGLALVFLLDIALGAFWPVVLILFGLGLILVGFFPR